jgi:hypothetical protein
MAQGIGSLTGAIQAGAGIYRDIQQNRRLDEEARRAQETHALSQETGRFKLGETQRDAALKAYEQGRYLLATRGHQDPQTIQYWKDQGKQFGIDVGGFRPGPAGAFTVTGPTGEPVLLSTGEPWVISGSDLDDVTRRAEKPTAYNLGDRTVVDRPTRRLREELERGPAPKAPLSPLDEELRRAQIGNLRSATAKHLREAQRSGRYGFGDFQDFVQKQLKFDYDGNPLPYNATILEAHSDAIRQYPLDPLMAVRAFSDALVERGGGSARQPGPDDPDLYAGTSPAGVGTGATPPAPGGVGEPEPQPAPPPAPPPESPQATALRAEVDRLRALQGPADTEDAHDLYEQERKVAERLRAETEKPRQLDDLRREIAETHSIPGTGDTAVAGRALRTWRGSVGGMIGSGVSRLFGGQERAGLEFLTLEDVNAALAEAGVHARIVDQGEGNYAVRAVRTGSAPVAGVPTAAPGSRRGGVVRAPSGGVVEAALGTRPVEALLGTRPPEGTMTRVRNLSRATGAPSVGAGMVRLIAGREF